MSKQISPMDASSVSTIVRMRSDNASAGDYWIIHDGSIVTLAHQKVGGMCTESVNIPRKDFNRLIRWYIKPQTVKS